MAKRRRIGFILLVLTVAIVGPSTELIHPPTKTDGSTQYIETSAEELDHTAIREEERPAQEKSYLNHSPISITSDADFAAQKAAEGWAGNGTQTNPYVIEGYNITHSGVNLEVANVSSYFIIRDCLIQSPGTPPPSGGFDTGIAIANSSNGIITNNVVRDGTSAGVFVGWTDCTVVNNEFYNNLIGIMFYNSSGSALYNDIVESVYLCVQIWDSIDCNVSFNTMTSDNDGVEFWDDSAHCTVTHNHIDSQDVGISMRGNAHSHVIAFNEIQGGEIGILAELTAGSPDAIRTCSFLENTIRHTSESGITSYGCQYCVFAGNIIIDCAGNGITFYGTDLCLVRYNEIRNNEVGIYHESGFDNAFYGNLLHNNDWDAIDHETEFDNFWDDGAGIGNCWTDSGFEGTHNIDGWANNVDQFPLLREDRNLDRPTIASTPDILTELGGRLTLVWVAWSGPGTYSLLLDGSELETDYWGGSGALIYEFEIGPLRPSNFTFVLYEVTGATATDTVLVSVIFPPQFAQLMIYSMVGLMIAVVVISEVSRDARFKRFWHRRK